MTKLQKTHFSYQGECGSVELYHDHATGQEGAFVGWLTMGAHLESLRPEAGLADAIDGALQVLGSSLRCNRDRSAFAKA